LQWLGRFGSILSIESSAVHTRTMLQCQLGITMKVLLRIIRHLLVTTTILALLVTNILSLTNTAFNAAVSGLLGTTLGIRTVSSVMQSRIALKDRSIARHKTAAFRHKAAARKFGTRLISRTRRVAAKSIAAIPAESIPFIGVAVLIADTGYELYAACESMRDLDELYSELGMEQVDSGDVMQNVCNPVLPDTEEVWKGVVARSGQWLEQVPGVK